MINLISMGSDIGNLTINAFNAIIESDIIVNYDNIDLSDLDTYLKDKEIIVKGNDESESIGEDSHIVIGLDESESIEEEEDIYSKLKENYSKIELAISKSSNKNVAMICSNSAKVYGIANLLIQVSSKYKDIELKIYPAVSPIDYSSAVLGAPFNDFAAIDLNNPIVSESELKNKIKFALKNDLILFIHNPAGENFDICKKIVGNFNDELLCGIVNDNYSYNIFNFKDMDEESIKEGSSLVIGNKLTYKLDDYMITSSDYIVKPKFISQNIEFFERYLKDETPKGIDYDCEYLPCHKTLEACDFCYCPFYPCADGVTGGEWIKDKDVWSCQYCDWIHLEEPCKKIRKGLEDILEDKEDLKSKHIELLKLRRECLLKTLK